MSVEHKTAGNKGVTAGNNPATSSARDMEKLIDEQRNRIAFLEKELRSSQDGSQAGADKHRDLSEEHKHAEPALSESEERFRQMADYSPIPMAINDQDDNIIYLNKKFIEVFGYTLDDIPHLKHWWTLAYPDPRYRAEVITRWEKGVEEAVKGSKEIGPIDYIVTCKDGSLRYTEISGVPIGDKELVLLQDVTERKQAEIALRFTQFAVDKAGDEVYWIARDGRFHYVNEAACRALGYTRDELLQLTVYDVDPLETPRNWPPKWKGSGGTATFESFHRTKDGRTYPVEVVVNYISYDNREFQCAFARDITERKQAEEMLRFTQFSVDRAGEEIYWIAEDGRFHNVNDAACRVLGYTRDELLNMKVSDIDPEVTEENWPTFWARTNALGISTFETVHRTRAGKNYPVEVTSNNLRYNETEYHCAFARDITERKQAQEALQESEEKFRTLFERSQDIIYRVDIRAGRYLYFSPAAKVVLGYTPEEMMAMPHPDTVAMVHPDDRGKVKSAIAEASIASRGNVEFRMRNKSGDYRWLSANITVVRDAAGQPLYRDGMIRDITSRKRYEEALRESQDKFMAIFNRAALGMAISDSAGLIIDCNSAYQEILGYSKEELRATNFLDLTHIDDIAKNQYLQQQMNDGLLDTYQLEKRYIHKSGKLVLCKLTASAIRNPDGSLKYNLAIAEDITERKRMEEELKAAKQQSELYLDLMGHDINNMNQIALGYLELAENTLNYEGYLNRQHSMLISKPADTLRNASTLISNVRKLQREKTGQYALTDMDIDTLLCDIIGHYSSVPNREITINYEPCGPCLVKANELLRDVFTNLVGNAIKHSEEIEKLTINIRVEKVTVDGTDCYKVSVEDNGHGIPDKMKDTLFDRLSLDSTRARGKGFGLCLIKLLVDDYNGTFWVEDRVDGDYAKGARFVVMLPAVKK